MLIENRMDPISSSLCSDSKCNGLALIPSMVALKTKHETYLIMHPDGRLCHGRFEDRSAIEKIIIDEAAGMIALKVSKLWRYLSAFKDGRLGLTSQLKSSEKFTIEKVGQKIALKSEHGTYLCAMRDGTFKLQRHRLDWEQQPGQVSI